MIALRMPDNDANRGWLDCKQASPATGAFMENRNYRRGNILGGDTRYKRLMASNSEALLRALQREHPAIVRRLQTGAMRHD